MNHHQISSSTMLAVLGYCQHVYLLPYTKHVLSIRSFSVVCALHMIYAPIPTLKEQAVLVVY